MDRRLTKPFEFPWPCRTHGLRLHSATLRRSPRPPSDISGRQEASMTDRSSSADASRRDFLRTSVVLGGLGATAGTLTTAQLAQAQAMPPGMLPGTRNHYYAASPDKTAHGGYLRTSLKPLAGLTSGDSSAVETPTHAAKDDAEPTVTAAPGAESVSHGGRQRKGVDRRGAGPMQPTLF